MSRSGPPLPPSPIAVGSFSRNGGGVVVFYGRGRQRRLQHLELPMGVHVLIRMWLRLVLQAWAAGKETLQELEGLGYRRESR